jgi:pimeloyl-ACP methyl ester carboxylesterase
MLIRGHEHEFWEMFIKQECYNPTTIEPYVLDHWIECVKQPGVLGGILATYRAGFKNAEQNLEQAKTKLTIPIMTVGAPEFFGPTVEKCAKTFGSNVVKSEIYEECGHSLALEKPERLAKDLESFFLS